jgi:hypothetical protein
MRDPARIKKILAELEKVWQRDPDLRLCQLIENLLPTERPCLYCDQGYRNGERCIRCSATGSYNVSNYNIEDDVLLKKLELLNALEVCTPVVAK